MGWNPAHFIWTHVDRLNMRHVIGVDMHCEFWLCRQAWLYDGVFGRVSIATARMSASGMSSSAVAATAAVGPTIATRLVLSQSGH